MKGQLEEMFTNCEWDSVRFYQLYIGTGCIFSDAGQFVTGSGFGGPSGTPLPISKGSAPPVSPKKSVASRAGM